MKLAKRQKIAEVDLELIAANGTEEMIELTREMVGLLGRG